MTAFRGIGLDWPISSITGWGVVGVHLAIALCAAGGPKPILLRRPERLELDPLRSRAIAPHVAAAQAFAERFPRGSRPQVEAEFPVLHAVGGTMEGQPEAPTRGRPDLALAVFENTDLPAARDNARRFARIVAASRWNADVLGGIGVGSVPVVHQGVDPSLFHPAPQLRPFRNRFVVFSGGKIEMRKAQDLVAEAFRRFHQRRPDAFLVTCWQNPWPETAATILGGAIATAAPARRAGLGIDVAGWQAAMGLPADSCMDVDFVANGLMPPVIREADVALFPNRCEGGTNLVAMECMAAGVPTILSANTGHLDLLAGPDVA
ncbi:MAG: glycosyltransferase, partial [Alphaproteobacteria bacterium]